MPTSALAVVNMVGELNLKGDWLGKDNGAKGDCDAESGELKKRDEGEAATWGTGGGDGARKENIPVDGENGWKEEKGW